jgi:hypothetical protein
MPAKIATVRKFLLFPSRVDRTTQFCPFAVFEPESGRLCVIVSRPGPDQRPGDRLKMVTRDAGDQQDSSSFLVIFQDSLEFFIILQRIPQPQSTFTTSPAPPRGGTTGHRISQGGSEPRLRQISAKLLQHPSKGFRTEFENFPLCKRILINVTTCQNET